MLALAAPLTAQAEVEVLPPDAPALIQTTGAHPFWSETRQAWVPARELRAGEELRTQSGSAATVASLARQPGSQPVFNLEVETEHVYFVGEAGVLVHNNCILAAARKHHNNVVKNLSKQLQADGHRVKLNNRGNPSGGKFTDGDTCISDIVSISPDGKPVIYEIKTGNAQLTSGQQNTYPSVMSGDAVPSNATAEFLGVEPGRPLREVGYPNGIPVYVIGAP